MDFFDKFKSLETNPIYGKKEEPSEEKQSVIFNLPLKGWVGQYGDGVKVKESER